ncbi:MAG: N-acetylneuraminate synthase family protein [Bacteroidia bacterium]|nr:N-acetylneuraminate synthase family protein [Bacteroidia bacterium]
MIQNTFIIAEIAQAHEGSLGIAHSYIDALAETGVDAIKFQTHIAEAESSQEEQFRVNFSYEDTSRYAYWKRMEFTSEQWAGLKQHCEGKGMEFISSPFSIAAVELLEQLNVKRYKIGSGEITNYLMLDFIARTRKPIILSSGMSDWNELDETINFLKPNGNDLAIMQCTTAYPTLPKQWGLNAVTEMKSRYNLPIGYSDHSADIYACLAATTLGASILEFHVVFDHNMFGPDAKASLTIAQVKQLVKGVRSIETALQNNHLKNDASMFNTLKSMFGKSLAVNKTLKQGQHITINDLESKKPGNQGIPAREYQRIIGKKLKVDKQKWDFLNDMDLV